MLFPAKASGNLFPTCFVAVASFGQNARMSIAVFGLTDIHPIIVTRLKCPHALPSRFIVFTHEFGMASFGQNHPRGDLGLYSEIGYDAGKGAALDESLQLFLGFARRHATGITMRIVITTALATWFCGGRVL
jgi:hypothetical protein